MILRQWLEHPGGLALSHNFRVESVIMSQLLQRERCASEWGTNWRQWLFMQESGIFAQLRCSLGH